MMKLLTRQATEAAAMLKRIAAQKEPAGDKPGIGRENLLQIYIARPVVCFCPVQLCARAAASAATAKECRTPDKPQASQCRLKA
jgi:hypothetical protein